MIEGAAGQRAEMGKGKQMSIDKATGPHCEIDTRRFCTLPLAAVRLGMTATDAELFMDKQGVPRRCYHYRKDRQNWTPEEHEDFECAKTRLGVTEMDYPSYGLVLYSGVAVRQLCRL